MVDTYGMFALLYTWFPFEAQNPPFHRTPATFALRHRFMGEALRRKWFAYEQTMVTLLQAVAAEKRISRFFVGDIPDVPEGRESLASAIQQVERTGRVFKTLRREQHQSEKGWLEQYFVFEQIRAGPPQRVNKILSSGTSCLRTTDQNVSIHSETIFSVNRSVLATGRFPKNSERETFVWLRESAYLRVDGNRKLNVYPGLYRFRASWSKKSLKITAFEEITVAE